MIHIIQNRLDDSIVTPNKWLNRFLSNRGGCKPDGKPLYEYQTTAQEFEQLKSLVIKFKSHRTWGVKSVDWSACFTLFCAQWYQRNYEGGDGWSWAPIWKDVDFSLSPSEIKSATTKGIEKFWCRPIKTYAKSRNFLGTVFSEGGLPFRLLATSDNRFGAALKRILKDVSRAALIGEEPEHVVSHHVETLPKVFSEVESIQLITLMTDKLLTLVDIFELNNKDNPAKYLDQSAPLWREDFPIPLDLEVGNGILNTWLKDASSERKQRKRAKSNLSIEHFLNVSSLSINSKIELPELISLPASHIQFKSNRVELALYEGTVELTHIGGAYLSNNNNNTTIRLRTRYISALRVNPSTHLDVVILQSGQEISRWPVQHSTIDLGDVPVGFESHNDKFKFVGQATFSSKKSDLYLVTPINSTYEVTEGTCESWQTTSTSNSVNFLKLNGQVTIYGQEEERFRVKTSDLSADQCGLSIFGEAMQCHSEPSSVFLGPPKYRINQLLESATKEKLFTFLGKHKIENLRTSETYGRQTISFKNQSGETLLKKRVGILPKDTVISTVAGDKLGEGKIFVNTTTNMLYEIGESQVTFIKKNTHEGVVLELSCDELPPATVSLLITPNILSLPIKIVVPYPRKGVLAFDKNGRPLAKSLSINELLGSRLHLFAPVGCPVKYEIDIALVTSSRTPAHYRHKYQVQDKPLVISLYSFKNEIKELFSLEADLDSQVRIIINSLNSKEEFLVHLYNSRVEQDLESNTLRLKSQNTIDIESMPPQLMQMSTPERKPIELIPTLTENVGTGDFKIPNIDKTDGPWLIIPAQNQESSFRSKLLFIPKDELLEECDLNDVQITSLHRAVQCFHPRFNFDVIAKVLTDMVDNLNHSGWEYLKNLNDNFGYIPMSTFQVWKDLVNNPEALLICLFRLEGDAQFIEKLETEFPILWHTISPQVYINTHKKVSDWLNSRVKNQDVSNTITLQWFEKILTHLPCYDKDLCNYLKSKVAPPQLPDVIMQNHVINGEDGWIQGLMREHGNNDDWPDDKSYRLKSWYEATVNISVKITNEHQYSNSVIYLPIFLAAVAAGKANLGDIFNNSSKSSFDINKIRDFDQNWFSSVYSYHLFKFIDVA